MKGFTLIEIMISLAILGISFVVLLGLKNRDIVISSEANHIVVATLLARERMAFFSLDTDKEVGERQGTFEEPYQEYKWAIAINETPFPKIYEWSVDVLWNEQNREEKVMVTTYINSDKP
ncbi:MAG: prepilin-type N-terminal cleavage/methylation domain-containing protein [Nitrospirae bacterium]|nr:prepilin-type N-terminal cleavage/methylation domain-containing protein [Candidatus Troglogloeales bacterium]MBI3598669.1 prepilin-type N-terminal cleavage/methylation domain-containing protein [Candidatus Troglogloeales bacterium]